MSKDIRTVAFVGSRNFTDMALVRRVVDEWNAKLKVTAISGGDSGPDTQAIDHAKKIGMETQVFEADWSAGKGAGLNRNRTIVHQADFVEVFWDGESRGTLHIITLCQQKGKSFRLHKARKARHKIQDLMVALSQGMDEKALAELYEAVGGLQDAPPDGRADGSVSDVQWQAARDFVNAMKNAIDAAQRFASARPQ